MTREESSQIQQKLYNNPSLRMGGGGEGGRGRLLKPVGELMAFYSNYKNLVAGVGFYSNYKYLVVGVGIYSNYKITKTWWLEWGFTVTTNTWWLEWESTVITKLQKPGGWSGVLQ